MNGSGRSPKALTIDYVREQGVLGNSIPASNLNCVTVPGSSTYHCEATTRKNDDWDLVRCCCCMG